MSLTAIHRLYLATEDPASTTAFTDFFPANGTLVVLKSVAVGAAQILALKQALISTDGSEVWNHMPNVTTVFADTGESTTFDVLGVIQSTIAGECSQA